MCVFFHHENNGAHVEYNMANIQPALQVYFHAQVTWMIYLIFGPDICYFFT